MVLRYSNQFRSNGTKQINFPEVKRRLALLLKNYYFKTIKKQYLVKKKETSELTFYVIGCLEVKLFGKQFVLSVESYIDD